MLSPKIEVWPLWNPQITFEVKSCSIKDYICPPYVVEGRRILRAIIHREHPHSRDPTDPTWLAAMSPPAEIAMQHSEWRGAGLERAKDSQLGPQKNAIAPK